MIGRVFLGRYEAKRLLGEGGTGRVFLARQFNPDRYVVVKVMHEHLRDDAKFQERFHRETQAMARFRHPHSVALLDASFDDPEGPCIVMEYIAGVGLDKLLMQNKRFTPARVGRLVGQLCDVLQAAHERAIIHRDLKPSNLIVADADTPEEQIKVMDFGLAKIVDPTAKVKKVTDTGTDFAVGTPGYISPEQVRGEPTDYRADLYSAGVIAYQLLAGRLPFEKSHEMDMILAHATEPPPTFEELGLRSWVPAAVERIVLQCLDKNPEGRPQSARELADSFSAALAEPDELEALPADHEAPESADPDALIFHFDAWMPQRIAEVTMRGFVHDCRGEVIETEPGLLRVHLGIRGGRSQPSGLSWFGLARRISAAAGQEMELRLRQIDPNQENRLQATVLFRPPEGVSGHDFVWRERCAKVFCEVRAYLMGNSER